MDLINEQKLWNLNSSPGFQLRPPDLHPLLLLILVSQDLAQGACLLTHPALVAEEPLPLA